jgi:fatty acid desaturase
MISQACGVAVDQIQFRQALTCSDLVYPELQRKNVTRVLLDLAFDYVVILASVYGVWYLGLYVAPLAILIIANRQRAMGNLLHDASHRSLFNSGLANDLVSVLFLAPALFNSLPIYRKLHARHHAFLGDPLHDPDYILPIAGAKSAWWLTYRRHIFSVEGWRGSVMGHLGGPNLRFKQSAYICLWWFAALTIVSAVTNIQFSLSLLALWLIAKASVFHMITTFREMCDHFGLEPGGIFSFTRDISTSSPWHWIVHPRNNGYHLTHHLIPTVPYYRLHRAYEMLNKLPLYCERGLRNETYFYGKTAVVQHNS